VSQGSDEEKEATKAGRERTLDVRLDVSLESSRLLRENEMNGLVFSVVGSGEVDGGEDVERDLAVGRRVVDGLALAEKPKPNTNERRKGRSASERAKCGL